MALKIRLSRGGSKKRPFYRIVVAEAAAPRDGRYVERVGHYNPMAAKDNEQRLVINGERIKHWLGLGAKPTERVQKLLSTLELMEAVKIRDQPKKSAPGKKRTDQEAKAAAKAAEKAASAEKEAAEAAEAAIAEKEAAEKEAAEMAAAEQEAPEAAKDDTASAEESDVGEVTPPEATTPAEETTVSEESSPATTPEEAAPDAPPAEENASIKM